MSNTVISVEDVSKSYQLGVINTGTFSGDVQRWWANLRGLPDPHLKIGQKDHGNREGETLWALRDINFTVQQGEAVGIIGRNGAGKSTLLKILSRVTAPTSGAIKVKGKIASLLEVGTGFHPELTGRENIFLNGAIMGMSRREMQRKFDEIVDFSDIEQFIDTPVKRYSSGMYVRLAFAVAAHLEPEILVVDEVLAVGDAAFQKKCLGKMGEVAMEGRTVLFVSHNMNAITRLCERVMLLDKGWIIKDGVSQQVVKSYLMSDLGTTAARSWPNPASAPGNEVVRLCQARVRTEGGQTNEIVDIRQPIGIEVEFEVLKPGMVLVPNYHFYNQEGVCVFIAADQDSTWRNTPRLTGCYVSTAWVPGNFLAEGTLIVNVAISTMNPVIVHVHERDAIAFQVVDNLFGDSARGEFAGNIPGLVRPLLKWETQYRENHQNSTLPSP